MVGEEYMHSHPNKNAGRPSYGTKPIRRLSLMMMAATAFVSLAVAQSPEIKSVSRITTQQFQTIVIRGTGFGTLQPYTGDSIYISFQDTTRGWQGGYNGCFWGCTDNVVTLIVDSWQDNKITLGGFSGGWGENDWTLAKGDAVQIDVWNPQSMGHAETTATVHGETTQVFLYSSPAFSGYGQAVTFQAVVSSDLGPPPDGETVTFMDGKKVLGTGILSGGSASFTTSTLSVGTHSITSIYPGDPDFDNSRSDSVPQLVLGWVS